MPALFDLLEQESELGVRTVPGHRMFGNIHPYPDGSERMARSCDEGDARLGRLSVNGHPG